MMVKSFYQNEKKKKQTNKQTKTKNTPIIVFK